MFRRTLAVLLLGTGIGGVALAADKYVSPPHPATKAPAVVAIVHDTGFPKSTDLKTAWKVEVK
jgi:hypothetical protein